MQSQLALSLLSFYYSVTHFLQTFHSCCSRFSLLKLKSPTAHSQSLLSLSHLLLYQEKKIQDIHPKILLLPCSILFYTLNKIPQQFPPLTQLSLTLLQSVTKMADLDSIPSLLWEPVSSVILPLSSSVSSHLLVNSLLPTIMSKSLPSLKIQIKTNKILHLTLPSYQATLLYHCTLSQLNGQKSHLKTWEHLDGLM